MPGRLVLSAPRVAPLLTFNWLGLLWIDEVRTPHAREWARPQGAPR